MEPLFELEDFLALGKEAAVNYDFKREIFKRRGIAYQPEKMIDNIIRYKGNIFLGESDCDRIKLTLAIYNTLWSTQLTHYSYFDEMTVTEFLPVNGETMNSFTTIYKIYTTIMHNEEKYLYENAELNRFARLTHSIGNFIPVYALNEKKSPFNSGRNRGTNDYWDLTMLDIKRYLEHHANPELDRGYNYAYIEQSRKWLDSFHTFDEFCEQNFLDDWKAQNECDWNNEHLFWESHHLNRRKVDFFKDDSALYDSVLKKINDSIIQRGEKMYDALLQKSGITK